MSTATCADRKRAYGVGADMGVWWISAGPFRGQQVGRTLCGYPAILLSWLSWKSYSGVLAVLEVLEVLFWCPGSPEVSWQAVGLLASRAQTTVLPSPTWSSDLMGYPGNQLKITARKGTR
jgi:hypothetical protein